MELVQKLKLKSENSVFIINAPDGFDRLLPAFDVKVKFNGSKPVSQLMIFVRSGIELANCLHKVESRISYDTMFWICYPKKTGSIVSDLITMKPWEVIFNSGFRGQTSVSINDDWTGMRFTNAPKKKKTHADIPITERKAEGIDYVNRTVTLPADAQKLLGRHKGLVEFFNQMSFSHKREYTEYIVDAKKPETRIRRIEKMAEMLQKMQSEKELRKLTKTKR